MFETGKEKEGKKVRKEEATPRCSFALSSLLLFSVSLFIFALPSRSLAVDSGGAGYFSPGVVIFTGLSNLNSFIAERGFDEIPPYGFEFGGHGYFFLKNFVIGAGGAGGFTMGSESNASTLSLGYGYGQALLGYVVIDKEKLLVFPLLGIGAGGVGFTVSAKETKSFGDLLAKPTTANMISFSRGMLVGSLSIDLVYFTGKLRKPKGEDYGIRKSGGGLMLGIKVGYFLDIPIDKTWGVEGTEVNGVPDFNMSHIFVLVSIGGGGLAYK